MSEQLFNGFQGRVNPRLKTIGVGEQFGDAPFFEGEVEPCINGRVLAVGAYFGEARESSAPRPVGRGSTRCADQAEERRPNGVHFFSKIRNAGHLDFQFAIHVFNALVNGSELVRRVAGDAW